MYRTARWLASGFRKQEDLRYELLDRALILL